MKCLIVLTVVLAVVSAQFGRRPNNNRRQFFAPLQAAASSVTVARAAPRSSSDQGASIVNYENDASPDGSYNYNFQTDNGISAQAQGTPRDFGGNPKAVADVAQGSFSWTSPEGEQYSLSYIADENGFQPSGAHLPVAPEIPPAIARALEYIARNPQQKKK